MSHLLNRAIALAVYAHTGQTNKSGMPYILHPLAVMSRVSSQHLKMNRCLAPEGHLITAVLHDVVEDTDVDLVEIEVLFGAVVRDAVDSVTRREGETYTDYVIRAKANPIGRAVKQADLIENIFLGISLPLPEPQQSNLLSRYRKALEELAS
jgi:(p)ppGpp synthase/HD superfamily hydrolase